MCNGCVCIIIGFDHRFFRFKNYIIVDGNKSAESARFFEISR